jgi:hypothetical protein
MIINLLANIPLIFVKPVKLKLSIVKQYDTVYRHIKKLFRRTILCIKLIVYIFTSTELWAHDCCSFLFCKDPVPHNYS